MVASGFLPDATSVAPPRLVAHLVLALLLYGGVLWTALGLWPPGPRLAGAGPVLRTLAWATIGLVALTIAAGGLVSGLHAGLTYNTFPLMDGSLVPEGYAELRPFTRNLIENIAAVQFDHRVLASLSLLSAFGLTIAALPYRDILGWRVACVPIAAATQYALGVTTLLLVVPVDLAVAHQVCAILLLTSVLLVAHAVRGGARNPPRSAAWTGSAATRRRTRRIWPGRGHGQTGAATPFHRSVTPSDTRQSAAEDPKP
jgi:cytochrome c oxidase assembly protein subunit 15